MEARQLALAYVTCHNQGVGSGDFGPLLALFRDTAELRFEAVDYGPFWGREAIREAFRDNPPSDELEVLDIAEDEHGATLTYAWRRQPAAAAGTLRVEADRKLIQRLTVGFTSGS